MSTIRTYWSCPPKRLNGIFSKNHVAITKARKTCFPSFCHPKWFSLPGMRIACTHKKPITNKKFQDMCLEFLVLCNPQAENFFIESKFFYTLKKQRHAKAYRCFLTFLVHNIGQERDLTRSFNRLCELTLMRSTHSGCAAGKDLPTL